MKNKNLPSKLKTPEKSFTHLAKQKVKIRLFGRDRHIVSYLRASSLFLLYEIMEKLMTYMLPVSLVLCPT